MFEFDILQVFEDGVAYPTTEAAWARAYELYALNNLRKFSAYRQYKRYSPRQHEREIDEMENGMRPLIAEILKNGWKFYVEKYLREVWNELELLQSRDD